MRILKRIWPFIFLLCIFTFGNINDVINGINENKMDFNFQITKIESTPTNRLIIYNKKKEIDLWNYTIMKDQGVQVGDYLIKEKCAKFLVIKRKNENGKLVEITRSNNESYFANLFCN